MAALSQDEFTNQEQDNRRKTKYRPERCGCNQRQKSDHCRREGGIECGTEPDLLSDAGLAVRIYAAEQCPAGCAYTGAGAEAVHCKFKPIPVHPTAAKDHGEYADESGHYNAND